MNFNMPQNPLQNNDFLKNLNLLFYNFFTNLYTQPEFPKNPMDFNQNSYMSQFYEKNEEFKYLVNKFEK